MGGAVYQNSIEPGTPIPNFGTSDRVRYFLESR